jgi:formiminoglutamase
MSSTSANAAAWDSRLEPAAPPADLPARPDDPRLGESVEFWQSGPPSLRPGRPVLVGFPQDEGVRRNLGRPGAAAAPAEIRRWLYRLTPWDGTSDADLAALNLLDLGNLRIAGTLEQTQEHLAEVVAALLNAGAVPIVLGGGHETAFGHYLGYVRAGRPAAILNLDAHLDVRPFPPDQGHSGSPFRQALTHPTHPLLPDRYACLGAQPFAVARDHLNFVREGGGRVYWAPELAGCLERVFRAELSRGRQSQCSLYVTLDADVVRAADVPGVSAPNPLGLPAAEVAACARLAGAAPGVASFDVVEVAPPLDLDGRSARWAALAVWHFLAGLARRPSLSPSPPTPLPPRGRGE